MASGGRSTHLVFSQAVYFFRRPWALVSICTLQIPCGLNQAKGPRKHHIAMGCGHVVAQLLGHAASWPRHGDEGEGCFILRVDEATMTTVLVDLIVGHCSLPKAIHELGQFLLVHEYGVVLKEAPDSSPLHQGTKSMLVADVE